MDPYMVIITVNRSPHYSSPSLFSEFPNLDALSDVNSKSMEQVKNF